ncbi:ABC transporter ATP-binding protein [Aestuariirhabdus sp. Z084]|uniref:ABC transporter ATP-binding protein n=1 Tax=Aestuariirhabdus haliotis TaxID=2918751 RepID=UPI00201B3B56|nr:ABC transporter ATP-binding protein [Aestuariirhabdus haliotis]MCL6417612.1 ABC transporter ATP-binding protein [Aestuariirhabdus haliotis]MCL6421538.1 ABC transporter ATP-binding protein [Aestuariirhabdus haliotis]
MSLNVDHLTVSYGAKRVLDKLQLSNIAAGRLTVLLGPNAAGKSTLFKSLAGLIAAEAASISLNGVELQSLTRAKRFQSVSYMPQVFSANVHLTVFEAVLLARKSLSRWQVDEDDLDAVEIWLQRCQVESLADRYVSELSGGQQQLVSLCQMMVRSPDLILLDEPTSALDLKRQLQVMSLLKAETVKRNAVTIVAMHDLGLAARFADQVILMNAGRVLGQGDTETLFSSSLITETYGVQVEVLRSSRGELIVAPLTSDEAGNLSGL